MRRAPALVSLVFLACIPLHEIWRPALAGRLVATDAGPKAGVIVHACTVDHWAGFSDGCVIESSTRSDADGGFAFAVAKRWDWLVPGGEAPLPSTLVYTCTPQGTAKPVAIGAGAFPRLPDNAATYLAHACPRFFP